MRVNRLQYGKLQKAKMCPPFDPKENLRESINFKTLILNKDVVRINIMFVKYFITSFAVHVPKRYRELLDQIAEGRVLLLPPTTHIPCRTTACEVSNMRC